MLSFLRWRKPMVGGLYEKKIAELEADNLVLSEALTMRDKTLFFLFDRRELDRYNVEKERDTQAQDIPSTRTPLKGQGFGAGRYRKPSKIVPPYVGHTHRKGYSEG